MKNKEIFIYTSTITILVVATAITIANFIQKKDKKIEILEHENLIMNEILDDYLKI